MQLINNLTDMLATVEYSVFFSISSMFLISFIELLLVLFDIFLVFSMSLMTNSRSGSEVVNFSFKFCNSSIINV